ncbi:hypothetical protein PRIPAC_72722 [Pristionchus pacificus]|nr:hypothetical protein PRIPAC_72722 [Pristionchus pacificus]
MLYSTLPLPTRESFSSELFVLSTSKSSSVVVLRMLSKQLQLRIFLKVRYSLTNAFSVYR